MKSRVVLLAGAAILGVVLAVVLRRAGESSRVVAADEPADITPVAPQRVQASRAPARAVVGARPTTTTAAGDSDIIASTDPTSKDYDPVTLVTVGQAQPRDLMNKEPRDPAFAGPRELALTNRITARLHKRLKLDISIDVTCRTSSCEVIVQGADTIEQMNAVLDAMNPITIAQLYGIGEDPNDPHPRGMKIILLYSAAGRDHVAFEQVLKEHENQDEPAVKTP